MKTGRIVAGHGVIGNFLLGQPISQVLFRLQSQPKSFGPINIIQSDGKAPGVGGKQEQPEPIFVLLPSGFKFRFDPVFHRLEQIEIFTDVANNQYTVPDMLLGSQNNGDLKMRQSPGPFSIMSAHSCHLTYADICQ